MPLLPQGATGQRPFTAGVQQNKRLRANSLNAIKFLVNHLNTTHVIGTGKKSLQCHSVAFKRLTKISMAFKELTQKANGI